MLCAWPLLCPGDALAYSFSTSDVYDPVTGNVCPIDSAGDQTDHQNNREIYGFTQRVILCIREPLLYAVTAFLAPFLTYLIGTISACCLLAVVMWGALMVAGKNSAPVRDLAVLAVKIGGIMLFTTNFMSIYVAILDSVDYMLGVVTSYVSYSVGFNCPNVGIPPGFIVWYRIDCAIEALIGGVFSEFTLTAGIVGFIVGCLFSGPMGMFIALMIILLIAEMLVAVARALYIFITSYLAIAFMMMVSPIFVPLLLFKVTKGYFEKWLKTLFGFVLQPIFLAAYLCMMLAAYDTVVFRGSTSLYRAIAGTVVDGQIPWWGGGWWDCTPSGYTTVPPGSLPVGDWLISSGVYAETSGLDGAVGVDWRKASKMAGEMDPINTGVIGRVAKQVALPQDWENAGGNTQDVFSLFLQPANYFKIDVPVVTIDWFWLACNNGFEVYNGSEQSNKDNLTEYFVYLLLSCMMAVITGYIFLTMLDALPFVGAGIAGDPLSMPPLGTGGLSMPGSQMFDKYKLSSKLREGITGGNPLK